MRKPDGKKGAKKLQAAFPTGAMPIRKDKREAKQPRSDAEGTPAPGLVVGIGASAGGLEAFKTFFANMPPDSGMAFVLVQHLSPSHKSMLAELVGKTSSMPVAEAVDGAPVAANRVYVIPPDATLTIKDRRLRIVTPAPPREQRRPIDAFFSSLAEDQGENAVSIVLSGTGSDGALGLSVIKEHGGLTLAQAEFDHSAMSGMPQSAAATGLVDDVLAVDKMPARLAEHQRHLSRVGPRKNEDGVRADALTHLATICALLRAKTGHDFVQYKEKTLVRRIQRRMQVLQVDASPAYIARLKQEPGELDLLFRELLIGVTEFFRDPQAFEALETSIIPKLLENKEPNDAVRIWVPGCASGEEVYSIAILVKEAMKRQGSVLNVQIFGTDIDERAIAVARAGRYRKPLVGVSNERVERWFADDGAERCAIKEIRETCVFSTHSLLKDPPFSKLDLISCRNLLIYFNADLQDRVMQTFHYALRPGGALFLGPSEGIGRNARLFPALDKKHRIFHRSDAKLASSEIPLITPSTTRAPAHPTAAAPLARGEDRIDRSARRALEKYSPVYVVVDKTHKVLHFSGSETGHYLGPSPGAASLNLFDILRKPLRPIVRAAMQTMSATNEPVVHEGVAFRIEGKSRIIRLIVAPLAEVGAEAAFSLVAFQDAGPRTPRDDSKAQDRREGANIQALEQDLRTTKTQLQTAIDEFETVNEEMKSANEEYQSVNEELQSSNEELETAKEEMQSVNEELQTINAEMSSKNEQLVRLNSDLKNLFDSTDIATIFLDNDLRIKNFTPGVTDIFPLRDADRGRPITDIVTLLSYAELQRDVKTVIRKLSIIEREVEIAEKRATFVMRIRPYRAVGNVLDGVVITFFDISDRKKAENILREHAAIVEFAQDALIGVNLDRSIRSWNPAAERLFGYSAKEAIGRPISDLAPLDLAQEQIALVDRVIAGKVAGGKETVRRRRDGSNVDIEITVMPIRNADGDVVSLSESIREITQRKEAERQTALLMGELDHRVKNILSIVSSVMLQTLKTSPSPGAFAANMEGRITAITRAHSLLTKKGGREEATLRELVAAELAPYDRIGNLAIVGDPRDLALTPKSGLTLAMTIHELASNAAKYGALSTPAGRLMVAWTIDSESHMLNFSWTETGGPAVKAPSRKGFGTTLIERTLKHEFEATVVREFLASGLRCTIAIPLTDEVGRVSVGDNGKKDGL